MGTFKNVSGSDRALCHACPSLELPHRAIYVTVRGIPKFYFGYLFICAAVSLCFSICFILKSSSLVDL